MEYKHAQAALASNLISNDLKNDIRALLETVKDGVATIIQKGHAAIAQAIPLIGRLQATAIHVSVEKQEAFSLTECVAQLRKVFDHVDEDIVNWFKDVQLTSSTGSSGIVRTFTENITNANIIADCKAGNIYHEPGLIDALNLAEDLLKKGALHMRNSYVVIYLGDRNKSGSFCRLYVYCNDGGRLELGVRKVDPDGVWSAGYGVLSSN